MLIMEARTKVRRLYKVEGRSWLFTPRPRFASLVQSLSKKIDDLRVHPGCPVPQTITTQRLPGGALKWCD